MSLPNQTTATLYFTDVNLSAFSSFPDLGIEDFGIVGTDLFEGDTLVSSQSFHTSIGLKELLFDDKVVIKEIAFDSPTITLITLTDGQVKAG